jgi:hypothetical protein
MLLNCRSRGWPTKALVEMAIRIMGETSYPDAKRSAAVGPHWVLYRSLAVQTAGRVEMKSIFISIGYSVEAK